MPPSTSDAGPQTSLSALGFVCGLMGGGLACLFVLTVVGHIERGVEFLVPVLHSANGMLAFFLCLYAIWLLAAWWFVRTTRVIFWAFVSFPLPPFMISVLLTFVS